MDILPPSVGGFHETDRFSDHISRLERELAGGRRGRTRDIFHRLVARVRHECRQDDRRGIELSLSHQVPVTLEPRDFGLACDGEPDMPMFGPPEEGQGSGDNPALVQAAGDVNLAVLAGEHGPARNATLLGAALILKAAGRCHTFAEGVSEATEALDSGEASAVLERLKALA